MMTKDLFSQSTNKVLLSMSIPVSLGMLSTILFQVVDTYFVGTLGPVPLTALSFASTVYFLLVGLFIGLSVAVSILVGKYVGQDDRTGVRRTATLSIILSFFIPCLFSLVGISFLEPIFHFLGAEGKVMPHIADYMVPMFIGMPILSIGIVAGAVMRASGKVKLPEVVFGIAGIINLVLDYAFIFGKWGFPALGIEGVAIGTVISWIFILVVLFFVLVKDNYLIPVFRNTADSIRILKDIYRLGLPSVITQMIAPFTLMYITFLLGQQSAEAVAGFGVAGRIETLLMIGIMGVSTASTPFIAQSFGAKKTSRIEEAIVFGGKAAFYLGAGLMILLLPFINGIAGLCSTDQSIIRFTTYYFYIVGLSYVLYSLYLVTASIFNGLQMPGKSLRVMLVRTIAFTFPLTLIGSYFGVLGVFVGLSLSNVFGGLYARFEMRKELKRVGSSLLVRQPIIDILNDFKLLKKA